MKILYIGDIMGRAGRDTVQRVLPGLKKDLVIDFVIAQAENISDDGKAPSRGNLEQMTILGVDFFTGGNHSFGKKVDDSIYDDSSLPAIRPANVVGQSGQGYRVIEFGGKKILIGSMLGQTVGSQSMIVSSPLKAVDEILEKEQGNFDISLFNFHGDYSSEKRVFGYYLDGRVTCVVGDHWHVPTADAMILPKGTAHISDVGMTGALHSSLGVKTEVITQRWLTGESSKNEMEESLPYQFCAVLIEVDDKTNKAQKITQIIKVIEK